MRELTEKEKKIFNTFNSRHTLVPVNIQGAALSHQTRNYIFKEPKVYKVEGTNAHLIFGELSQGLDYEKIKQLLANMKEQNEVKYPVDLDEAVREGAKTLNDYVAEEDFKDEPVGIDENFKVENGLDEGDVQYLIKNYKLSDDDAKKLLLSNNCDLLTAINILNAREK